MSDSEIMDAEEYCMSYFSEKKVVWDKNKPDEVEAARKQFESLVGKGYMAFTIGKLGEEKQIKEFDPEVGRIFFAPVLQGG